MANIIKVEPGKLRSASGEFASASTQIRNATSAMTQAVTSLSGSVWSGDAATAYVNKFNGLQDEIARIDKMIQEHSQDLANMANEYEKAETTNQQNAGALKETIF